MQYELKNKGELMLKMAPKGVDVTTDHMELVKTLEKEFLRAIFHLSKFSQTCLPSLLAGMLIKLSVLYYHMFYFLDVCLWEKLM